ncbi:MAG TPA: adventurous gliding motility protein CglE [Polyangia bacterium]
MPRLRLALLLALGMTMVGATRDAAAQVIAEPAPPPFPDPKKFAKGPFASGEVGAFAYLGRVSKYAQPGVAFGVRLGYDLFRWLDIQAHVLGASSDASTPAPQVGQSFQTYLYAGEVRLKVQIHRFQLFAEGGAALAQVSTNVLAQVLTHNSNFAFSVVAGGGLDYHTLNRHFSVGLGGDYVWMSTFTGGHALSADVYLRYTR